tara:strand:- start:195 stop:347 length:153 start_codon:yes stop_codon:yes gene_type:complete
MADKDALTPAQVKLLQKTLPSSSPYKDWRNYKGKGKAKFKRNSETEPNIA